MMCLIKLMASPRVALCFGVAEHLDASQVFVILMVVRICIGERLSFGYCPSLLYQPG